MRSSTRNLRRVERGVEGRLRRLLSARVAHQRGDADAQQPHGGIPFEAVEQLVLERAAKVKNDIAVLYALGNRAMAEARRGELVNVELTSELIKMSEERAS